MTATRENPRILVLGLDGATWEVIIPLMKKGGMQNLKKLCDQGVCATLNSVIPPFTLPTWTTFMTGVNPGRHGIFDFMIRTKGTYQLRFINSTFRKFPTVFRKLSDLNYRIGVLGLPATYPPEDVNGFMISGFDSPVATGIGEKFYYPKELYKEVKGLFGKYKITDFQELFIDEDWHRRAIQKLHETLDQKIEIGTYLYKKEKWDFFMVLFGESDTVSHHFWMFHDPISPRYDKNRASEFGEAINGIYQKLDLAIGRFIELADKETIVMILSDHGFGGAGDWIFYINNWLENEGFLQFSKNQDFTKRLLKAAKNAGLKILPPFIQEQVFRLHGGSLASKLESMTRFGSINWEKTYAYSDELNYFPSIWINLKGREPEGQVEDYEGIIKTLKRKLEDLKNPETGNRVLKNVHERKDIYNGPYVELAPDIILELELECGYSYSCLNSQAEGANHLAFRKLLPHEFIGAKGKGMNGNHRNNGIFIINGENIIKGAKLPPISILDTTPLIYEIFHIDTCSQLDGLFLKEIFKSIPERKFFAKGLEKIRSDSKEEFFLPEQEEEIKKRLIGLGYIEENK